MLLIGLTGSIATGKSTVSSILSQPPYSLPVIDADLLARQISEPGRPVYKAIVEVFAPTTPDLLVPVAADSMPEAGPAGRGRPLNRPALGRRVFGDDAQRRKERAVLNGIVHPAVRKAIGREVLKAYGRGYWACVLDVPLLFEGGLDAICGTVVVVATRDPEVQMGRLRARDPHLSREEAEGRVVSQEDVRIKASRCVARGKGRGLVVWNDGGKEDLRKEIAKAMGEIQAASPRWWHLLMLAFPPLAIATVFWTVIQNRQINKKWNAIKEEEKAKL